MSHMRCIHARARVQNYKKMIICTLQLLSNVQPACNIPSGDVSSILALFSVFQVTAAFSTEVRSAANCSAGHLWFTLCYRCVVIGMGRFLLLALLLVY